MMRLCYIYAIKTINQATMQSRFSPFRSVLLLKLFGLLVFISACRNNDVFHQEIGIESLNFTPNSVLNLRDTLFVEASLIEHDFMPLYMNLVVNGQVVSKRQSPPYQFQWIVNQRGTVELMAQAVYPPDLQFHSSSLNFEAVESGIFMGNLKLTVSNDKGQWPAYQDENLILNIEGPRKDFPIDQVKEMALWIDGEKIGEKTEAPFSFSVPTIGSRRINIYAVATDLFDRTEHLAYDLELDANDSSDISLHFNGNLKLSNDILVVGIDFRDPQGLKEIYVYLNGEEKYHKKNLDDFDESVRFAYFQYVPGEYIYTCMAIDQRNDTTFSEAFPYTVYKNIIYSERFVDGISSQHADLAFALTEQRLFLINPLAGRVIAVYEFPLSTTATAITYVSETEEVFISGTDQEMISFDHKTREFKTYFLPEIDNISDLEIDHKSNTAFLISSDRFYSHNYVTGASSYIQWEHEDIGAVAYDQMRELVFAGGRQNRTGSSYIYRVYNNAGGVLTFKEQSNYSLNSFSRIQLNSPKGIFIHGESLVSHPMDDVNQVVTEYGNNEGVASFSTNGDELYYVKFAGREIGFHNSLTGNFKRAISIPEDALAPDLLFSNASDSVIISLDNIISTNDCQITFIPNTSN